MNQEGSPDLQDASEEITALIETLSRTGQRLEELTAGEVDTVADRDGRTFLLRGAQEQLRHSEAAKQAAILNVLPAHIALLDAQGFIVSVNEAWRRFAGANALHRRAHGIGLNYLEICDSAQGEGAYEAHQVGNGIRSVVGGEEKSFSIEYACHSPTEQRWFLLTVTPLDSDRPNGAVVMHLNITEQKRAKDELRESERRFRELLENVDLIAITLDERGIVTFCNQYFLRLTSWTREEVIGAEWFAKFIPPVSSEAARTSYEPFDRGDVPAHHEGAIRTRNDELRDIVWSNTVLRDESGRVVGRASIGEDVTVRRRAEAELRQSEERFRELAESIQEIFWMSDPLKSQVLYVSPAYETIWGRSCASLYAAPQSWMDAIHPDDRERVLPAMLAKQTNGTYDEQYRITRPDGSIRWIHDRASPVRNAAGEVCRIAGVAEDITEQQQLESRFRQAQKMEAIGTLAGGIAHDFNNILAVIGGYTELLKTSFTHNLEITENLDAVASASARGANLVKQILMFSRNEESQRRPMRLSPVVEEAVKFLRSTIPTNIEIQVFLAEEVPNVRADPTQVHQIVMNLGTNAWHAMEGSGKLIVKLDSVDVDLNLAELHTSLQPGRYARLTVSDTGKGMDQATVVRIFEPFFTTKPVGEGTGLGLAVVHGIVQSHEGAIIVSSQPGQGTVFHLYFPADAGAALEVEQIHSSIPRGRSERVLYVDDELPLVQLGKKILERLGYVVEPYVKVAQALALVRAEPRRFDLVVTGEAMPGMSGIDFARELAQIRPDLPVILMASSTAEMTLERLRAAGIRELLSQPPTMASLGALVHRVLAERVSP